MYEKYVTEAPAEMVEYGIRAICRRRAGDREHELDLDEAGGSQFCFMWGNCLVSYTIEDLAKLFNTSEIVIAAN